MILVAELREDGFDILAGKLPREWFCRRLVERLEGKDSPLEFPEVFEVIRREDLPLKHGEIDFHLIQPTGMDESVNQHRIGIPAFEPGSRGLSPVGRPVVGDPEDAARGSIGRLRHDEIDQLMKARNASSLTAEAEDFGATNIPCRQVSQRPFPLVLMLDTARATRLGGGGLSHTPPRLNAGFLVGADDIVAGAQGFALPFPMVEIEHQTGLALEIRIPRPDPTAITPGADGIGAEPAPNRGSADRGGQCPA